MSRRRYRSGGFSVAALIAAGVFVGVGAEDACGQFYDFDTDGEGWPASFMPFDGPFTSDGVFMFNTTSDLDHFIDSGHEDDPGVGLVDASRLSGNAWYGGFEPFAFGQFDFTATGEGGVDSLAFDFATTVDTDFVDIFFIGEPIDPEDPTGGDRFEIAFLPEPFETFDGGTGWQGRVEIHASDYDLNSIQFFSVDPSDEFIFLRDSTSVAAGFAGIDNISINGVEGGGGGTTDSMVRPIPSGVTDTTGTLVGVSSSRIVGPGSFSGTFDLFNEGPDGTTYEVLYSAGVTDPGFFGAPASGFIDSEEILSPGAGYSVDTDQLSGMRSGIVTIHNVGNPLDPDDEVVITVELHDPVDLTANNDAPVDVGVSGVVSLSNAAAGPHGDALRAAAGVTGLVVSGSGFGVVEGTLAEGEDVFAGDVADTATVTHDSAGLLNGKHFGTLTAVLEARTFDSAFAFFGETVDDVVWDLEATVTGSTGGVALRAVGESLAGLGAMSPGGETVVEILDGTAAEAVLISMVFEGGDEALPEAGVVLGTAVDLTFDVMGGAFVLAVEYDDTGLSAEEEAALRLLYFDDLIEGYVNAVLGNSDAGSVGESLFFAASYADYLAFDAPGGVFELGAYGVDVDGNTVWAAIDHNTLFGAGVAIPEPGVVCLLLPVLGVWGMRRG